MERYRPAPLWPYRKAHFLKILRYRVVGVHLAPDALQLPSSQRAEAAILIRSLLCLTVAGH